MRIDVRVTADDSVDPVDLGELNEVAGGAGDGEVSLGESGVTGFACPGGRGPLQALAPVAAAESASAGIVFSRCRRDTGLFTLAKCKQTPGYAGAKAVDKHGLVQRGLDVVPSGFELHPEGFPVVGAAVAVVDLLVVHSRFLHALFQIASALVSACLQCPTHR